MSVISTPAVKTDINTNIFQNSSQLITGTILNGVLINIADSYLNRVTGGLLMQSETGYTTLITLVDDKAFVHKKYVDDSISGLLPTGTAAQYFRGDKSLSDFQSDVRGSLLTGLPTFTNTVISATDSVLGAFSNLQGQINAIDLSGFVPYTGSTASINQNGFGITNSTGLTTTTISATYAQLSSLSVSVIGTTQNAVLSKIGLTINETSLSEITRLINGGLVYQGTTFATTFLLPTNKGILTTETFAMLSDIANSSTETITAGENLVAGDLVYLKNDGKYWKADYLDETKVSTELRYVLQTILANATGSAQITGNVTSSGLTVGERYCVGASGAIVLESAIPDTEGIFIRYVGTAESATDLFFNPESTYIEVTLTPPTVTAGINRLIENRAGVTATLGSAVLTDYVQNCTGTNTLTLPTAVSNNNKYTVTLESGTTTINTTGGQTINGSTSIVMALAYQSLDFISNGSNWLIR
jgi:hypothetical protein